MTKDVPGEWRGNLHWHDHALGKLPGLTADDLDEAVNDPNRIVIDPDPKSKTGLSYRVIGWSIRLHRVMTVVMLRNDDGTECCLTTFPTKGRDHRLYQQGEDGDPA